MNERDLVSTITIKQISEGAAQVQADLKGTAAASDKLSASTQALATVTETTARRQTLAADKFKAVERSLDPAARALFEYEKIQRTVSNAVSQNAGLQDRANAVLHLANERYQAVVGGAGGAAKAITGVAQTAGLARHELVNLSRQAQDVAVSLGSGQSFGTVMLQQGTQIADVFATSGGTVRGFFGQLASGAASVLTPMRLVVGGAIGIGAATAALAINWDNADKEMSRSLIGIGARTGTTVKDIEKFASTNASVTGLSVSQARDAAIEFTKTGDIAVGQIKGLGQAVHGYSVLTGKTATDATKDLAQALSGDLVAGAQKLNQTYGFLNPQLEENIRTLKLQGDRAGAVQVIINAMAQDNQKAADSVSILTKAWTALGNAMSLVANAKPPSGEPGAAQKPPTVQSAYPGGYLNTREAYRPGPSDARQIDASGYEKEMNRILMAGDAAAKAMVPQIEQIHKLEQALSDLQRAAATVQIGSTEAFQDNGATTAIENQLAALRESQAQTERYNERVKEISGSWGDVGQSTALVLQNASNQVPVAEAIAGAKRLNDRVTHVGNLTSTSPLLAFVAVLLRRFRKPTKPEPTATVARTCDVISLDQHRKERDVIRDNAQAA